MPHRLLGHEGLKGDEAQIFPSTSLSGDYKDENREISLQWWFSEDGPDSFVWSDQPLKLLELDLCEDSWLVFKALKEFDVWDPIKVGYTMNAAFKRFL